MLRHFLLVPTLVLLAPALNSAAHATIAAQSTGTAPVASRPGAVTAVLVDSLPVLRGGREYGAVILRRAGATPGDVVLLPRATASGELLDAAVRTLLHARAQQGDRPVAYRGQTFRTLTIGVRPNTASGMWAARQVPLAQRIVDRLASTSPRAIAGVGTVPAVDFYPPQP